MTPSTGTVVQLQPPKTGGLKALRRWARSELFWRREYLSGKQVHLLQALCSKSRRHLHEVFNNGNTRGAGPGHAKLRSSRS